MKFLETIRFSILRHSSNMTEASAILLLFKLSVLIFRAKGFLVKYYFIKLVVKPKFFI
jgi:hypothetical protein